MRKRRGHRSAPETAATDEGKHRMTRSTVMNYALFALAYAAIWALLIAPQTVTSLFGAAPRGAVIVEQIGAND